MLTIRQILHYCPPYIIQSGKQVNIYAPKLFNRDNEQRITCMATDFKRGKPQARYGLAIDCSNESKFSDPRVGVKCFCNCEFFTYWGCADVLFRHGSGFEEFATGYMPNIRNPSYVPFVCKHMAGFFLYILYNEV